MLDKLQISDEIIVSTDDNVVSYPCPSCSRATKAHHGPDERVCSNRICKERLAMKVFKGSDLAVKFFRSPINPCPKCGKESKQDHDPVWRVCSSRDCRARF